MILVDLQSEKFGASRHRRPSHRGVLPPGRCRNDAAFASLSGTCPIPASSGDTVRHRLNRGGDRALNRAIHTIATVRMRDCPTTKAYIARRTAEGKTIREIKRCLKRYIARQLYRTLTATMPHPPPTPGGRLTHLEASTSTRPRHETADQTA